MLEAVIMAGIMVSAVAFVATFESPASTEAPTRDLLRQRTQDALDVLYDTPVANSAFGENALSVHLAECMGGDCDALKEKLSHVLPTGAQYALYVSNGYDIFPVYEPRKPQGEAVTATHPLEPKWSHSFVTTGMTNVNPATDSLLAYSLPVFNSNTLAQGGSPLRVVVHGTRTSDGANYSVTGFYSTQAVATEDRTLFPAASMYFLGANGKPAATRDVGGTATSGGLPTKTNITFTVRLEETAGVRIPKGTELTVSLPRGWTGATEPSITPGWEILANATDRNGTYAGSDLVARLKEDLVNGTRDFVFRAKFHGDQLDWYPFQARLSKGALSEANLLVRAKHSQTASVFAVPQLAMSVPRPLGAGNNTTWTLAVDLPVKVDETVALPQKSVRTSKRYVDGETTTSSGGTPSAQADADRPDIVIDRIEIIEEDGAPIWGSVRNVSAPGGSWSIEGNRLVWTGRHANSNGTLGLVFEVNASGVPGAQSSKNPFVPPVQFDHYKSRLLNQVAPGLYRGLFLPESLDQTYPGYRNAENVQVGIEHTFTSDAIYKSTLLPGGANYTLNPVPSFQDSIHGSFVNVAKRQVTVGGTAEVHADVQSLLFALSQAGISAGVNLHVYPPWKGDVKRPIWSQPNLDAGLLGGEVTRLAVMDMNEDGRPDVVVGTSNGRVLALDGETGARLQGGGFTAPLQPGAPNGTVTSITHLLPYRHQGVDHLVVGTDKEGEGVYVLDKALKMRWKFDKPGLEVVSMAVADIDGGGDDILVALDNQGVFALRPPTPDEEKARKCPCLMPRVDQSPSADAVPDALHTTVGRPSALVGLKGIGPDPSKGGLAVTFQSTADAVAEVDEDDPVFGDTTIGVSSLPRAGFQGVDRDGTPTWTFFGSPVSLAMPYDHDGDAATDILAGSPAGYVYAMNGLTATQPLYSQVYYPASAIRDGDAKDPFHAAFLTSDGQARITTTGWIDSTCAYCSLTVVLPTTLYPKARGISLNASYSFWVVGEGGLMLRSVPGKATATGEPEPQYPELEIVQLQGARGADSAYLKDRIFHFTDVLFRWVPHNDEGWVVAGPCQDLDCTESLVMRTRNGGYSWEVLGDTVLHGGVPTLLNHDGTQVGVTLTRINFTTDKVGWIVGEKGTLLRTLDGGDTWRGVPTPTEEPLLDVSCAPEDPNVCMLLTELRAWRTDNALDELKAPLWAELEFDLTATVAETDVRDVDTGVEALEEQKRAAESAEVAKKLRSVALVSRDVAYIGAENAVLRTPDGGRNWTGLPMNYLEADGNRVAAFPDGRGFVFGGNASHGRVFFLHDYALRSEARTVDVLDYASKPLGAAEMVVLAELTTQYGSFQRDAYADFLISTDGGENWQSLEPAGSDEIVRQDEGLSTYVKTYKFNAIFQEPNEKPDTRLRIDFRTAGHSTLLTAQVRSLDLKLSIWDAETKSMRDEIITLDLADETLVDAGRTTAVWDRFARVIHQPLVQEYWTRNVSGEVRALATGFSVTGDARQDVWVATGGVLASNSPDHLAYAGSDPDKYVKNDNRVYLLDGKNGSVVARTASFPGNVTSLALSDADGDKRPEHLFATTWDPVRKNGTLVSLNATTLQLEWTVYLDVYKPSDLAANRVNGYGPEPVAVVGVRPSDSGQAALPGKVYTIEGYDGDVDWGSIPDQQGRYVITKKVPDDWFFGPYMVEVEVNWTSTIHQGAQNALETRKVLQTARFYDYFVVTPPDALAPPSPVYQVHLVTWFEEWR